MSGVGAVSLADTIPSPAAQKVAITLYRDGDTPFQVLNPWERAQAVKRGLVLVTETREVALPAGRHTLRFDGVAEGLIPQSAAIEGLPDGAIERNYDYALLSPGKLLERSLNQPVRITRVNRKTGKATEADAIVRQGPDGVVLQTAEGIEALGCSGGIERLTFERVPAGLSSRPSLSAVVEIPVAGRRVLTLSYLAIGLNWQADYVARIRPDGTSLDLVGWLTLVNSGGTSFDNAPTQLVAGKLAREAVDIPDAETSTISRQCWPMDTTHTGSRRPAFPISAYAPPPPPPPAMAAPMMDRGVEEIMVTGSRAKLAEQSELGDYKLYTLPQPVTVAARQTKQAAFLDLKAVRFTRLYSYRIDDYSDYDDGDAIETTPTVLLRLKNLKTEGLGQPMPSGAVAVMETAGGRPTLAGEQALRDVAVGQPFDIELGQAMDVVVRPKLERETERLGRTRRDYAIELINAKTVPVTLELRQDGGRDDFKLTAGPKPFELRDGGPAWRITLPPGERRVFRYGFSYKD